jgi:hypothetical protein
MVKSPESTILLPFDAHLVVLLAKILRMPQFLNRRLLDADVYVIAHVLRGRVQTQMHADWLEA